MEKSREIIYKKTIPIQIFMLIPFLGLFNISAEICEAIIKTCPEDIQGDTVTLPESVIALSSNIYVCEPDSVLESGSDNPPAVFFVIDHSGSMTRTGTNSGGDIDGVRFDVTRALIDSIHTKYPEAEVGISVFNNKLYFREENNPEYFNMFKTLSLPGYPDTDQGAYVPLTKLDKEIERTQEDTTLGIDVLKDILKTEWNGDEEYRDLVIQPSGLETWRYTNINTAMASAKAAFLDSDIPEENQYLIFISDGIATTAFEEGELIRDTKRTGTLNDNDDIIDSYVSGEDIPTTFTIFFNGEEGGEAPPDIQEFISNIRDNSYSDNNIKSDLWSMNADYDTLMNLFSRNILSTILQTYSSTPLSISVNSNTSREYNSNFFTFEEKFELNPELTPLDYRIKYNMTSPLTEDTIQKTSDIGFHIRRVQGAAVPGNVTLNCWEEPELEILYKGESPSVVREHMDTLEVNITPPSPQYYEHLDSFEICLTNLPDENNQDSLEIVLYYKTNGIWSGEFIRKTAEEDFNPNDDILQHNPVDSIRARYRNPEIPLDTASTSVFFEQKRHKAVVQSCYYFDNNADGYIDSVFFEINGKYPEAGLTENMDKIFSLSPQRGISIDMESISFSNNGNLGFSVSEDTTEEPMTSIRENDVVNITEHLFPGDTLFTGAESITIVDRMAPVILSGYASYYNDTTETETLHINFSEPVPPVSHRTPFLFRKYDTASEFSLDLDHISGPDENDTSDSQAFKIIENNKKLSQRLNKGDSVWISGPGYISDLKSNTQNNPENRRAPLDVELKDECTFDIHATVVQNIPDFLLSNPDISSELNRDTKGNIVIVSVDDDYVPFKLEGKISIYDLVGNPVLENRSMSYYADRNKLFYVWNRRNENNRIVKNFVYYSNIKITINNTREVSKRVMISLTSEKE